MLKRYANFINESKLDSYQQLPTGIDYIKDITYELVEYFNDELDPEDYQTDILNIEYGYLLYVNHHNWMTIPEDKSEDINNYWNPFSENSTPYIGWYMRFSSPDMWIASGSEGRLIKEPLYGVSQKRYKMLTKIQAKANEEGYQMKIFQNQKQKVDFHNILFISDKKLNGDD